MGVFAGWTAGLILTGALLWGFTNSVRNKALLNSVNRLLDTLGKENRLVSPLYSWDMPGRAVQAGTWFTTTNSEEWAAVFTMAADGVFTPFVVFVSSEGKAGPLIPLSLHAKAIFQRLSPGQLQIYIQRIEASHSMLRRVQMEKEDRNE
jgi:hypothetical protein